MADPTQSRHGGFTFFINPKFEATANVLIRDPMAIGSGEGVKVIKRNMVRTVFRLRAADEVLYVKAYHSRGASEALKSLVRPSRAEREWEAMHRLAAAGISTATPVFHGERRAMGVLRRAFFAATEIADALNFGAFVEKARAEGRWDEALQEDVYRGMARLTARMHAANIRHGDFHLGNILIGPREEGGVRIHLIDLHTVSFPATLSRKARVLNLARVGEVLCGLEEGTALDRFLRFYLDEAAGFAPSIDALRIEVMDRVTRLLKRRLRSRTRRCLLKSSEFLPAKRDGFSMNLRRTCTQEMTMEAIAKHDAVKNEGDPDLLHPVFKNKVTAVTVRAADGPVRLCVKEYRSRSWWARWFPALSEARRSWIAGRGLEVRGIPTPRTEAWIRKGAREFLITLFIEGRRLYEYQATRCAALSDAEAAVLQKELALRLARFVRGLHDAGVCHRDLSEQNIMVDDAAGTRRFHLIDCDTLTFRSRVDARMMIKNLIQLGHMPEDVNVMAKARFLDAYLGAGRRAERRALFDTVNRGILERMERKRRKFVRLRLPDPHPRPSRLKGGW